MHKWLVTIALLGVLDGGSLRAEGTVDATVRIARLVKRLGSDSFQERQAADRALAGLGPAARQQLEFAAQDQNLERRHRARKLLRRLSLSDMWRAREINYAAEDVSARDALASLARLSGNSLLIGSEARDINNRRVTVKYEGTGFWAALDDLCLRSGNYHRPSDDWHNGGIQISAGAPGKHPVAYCGPLRLHLTSIKRDFTEQFDFASLKSKVRHTFHLRLQVTWPDRFQLIAYRPEPELLEASSDNGETISSQNPRRTDWHVAGRAAKQLDATLQLQPPSARSKFIRRLVLRWPMIAAGDAAELEIPEPAAGSVHRKDDFEIAIQQLQQRESYYQATFLLRRTQDATEPREAIFREIELALFDSRGRAFSVQAGSQKLTTRGAEARVSFKPPSADAVPRLLRVTYPRIRSRKDVEFVIENVPLPSGLGGS